MINLPPPFWKTCRVLANETRLGLLWFLFGCGEQCVSDLMKRTGMSRPNTSNQLTKLAEYGLIISRREKMKVIYRAEANAAMPFAPPVLEALRECFNQSMSLQTVIRHATAFSHGRRVELIQELKGKSRTFDELHQSTGMSPSALSRHLIKLETRNFVLRNGSLYRYGKPGSVLGRTLLQLATGGKVETT